MGESMRKALLAAVLLSCVALTARAVTADIPATGLPTASHYASALLPEQAGVVSWRTLSRVESEHIGIRIVPRFSSEILELDQKDVKLQGFIVALGVGDKQSRFLISATPIDCQFCLPAGPEALVEVLASAPVRYSVDPVVVSGKFSVLKDEAGGLLYRLTGAQVVETTKSAPVASGKKP